jgi:hypothetical protein
MKTKSLSSQGPKLARKPDLRPNRWVIARRAHEIGALALADLAVLMQVSPRTLERRAAQEVWQQPAQVLSHFRAELAEQVAALRTNPEGGPQANTMSEATMEKSARTLQMMLRNFEKITELTGRADEQTAGGGGADDTQYLALRSELARRLHALRAEGQHCGT